MMKTEVTGTGFPLVLVPGGLTGWLSWKPHAEKLSWRFRVIRVQLLAVDLGLRGEPLPLHYSVDSEVEALAESLATLEVAEAHVAAWSYGAETALSYAVRHPERIRSLTLIEPPAIWVLRSRGPLKPDLVEAQVKLRTMGPGPISEDQLAWFAHFAGFVPPDMDPRKMPQWPSWVEHRQSLRTRDAAYRHGEDMSKVKAFTKPVLLFKGEGSSDFLNRVIDVLGEEFPRATVKQLPGGHALHVVSMDRFMETFVDFLGRADGP